MSVLQSARKSILLTIGLAILLATPAVVYCQPEQVHHNDMTPLNLQTVFPRFTPEQLVLSGYPDHCHAYLWPGWRPWLDGSGDSYGPGTLCNKRTVAKQAGLVVEPGHISWECFDLRFNPAYGSCDLMAFVEWCDVGRIRCRDLLELEADDMLYMVNPDNVQEYRERTGYGTWRHFRLNDDQAILQPIPLLRRRTLEGNAALELSVEWIVRENLGDRIPTWLTVGLAAYLSDGGVHMNNYMGQFRILGEEVLMSPAMADSVLFSPRNPDDEMDRRNLRCANYSAFIMVWHLVEDNGGFEPLRRLLHAVRAGESLATACRNVYGSDVAGLEARVDPLLAGEPCGNAIQSRRAHVPPTKN